MRAPRGAAPAGQRDSSKERSRTAVRVIGGVLGGRRLATVRGRTTRPTAERVREALFARLESRYGLHGARLLDLFAGTGALAIEALSRGAESVVCVDSDAEAARVLRSNVAACGLEGRVRVLERDFRAAADGLAGDRRRFGGVFLDPPYGRGLGGAALEYTADCGLLMSSAWASVEHERRESLPAEVGGLVRVREDRYGDTMLSLYEYQREGERH